MRARALLLVPIVLLLAGQALAQCRIEGVVRSADKSPVAGATVRIEGPGLPAPLTTTTDADGRYGFDNVKAGTRVRIVVLRSGRQVADLYALASLWVETIDIEERRSPLAPASTGDVIAPRGPFGEVGGVVRSASGTSMPAARVTIGGTTLMATTDQAGRYLIGRLRPGIAIQLEVSADGYKTASQEVIVPDGDRIGADFALEAAAPSGDQDADLPVLSTSAESGRFSARPEQAARFPSLGQNDLFRALQLLPGVAGTPEASGELFVRGGTPDQTLVTLDGYTLYQADHALARFSPLNMMAIETGELSRGVVSAADGGRLSGALRLTGRSNDTGRVSGSVDLGALGIGAAISVPLGHRGSFTFGTRRSPPASLYDDVLSLFADNGFAARSREVRSSSGTSGPPPISQFRDVNGRLDLRLTGQDRFVFSLYDGRDDLNHSRDLPFVLSADGVRAVGEGFEPPTDAVVQVSDLRAWKARGTSGAWTRRWTPAFSTTFSVARSDLTTSADRVSVLTSPSTREDYSFVSGRGGRGALAESNGIEDTTVRIDGRIGIGFRHALSVGAAFSSLDADYTARHEVFDQTIAGVPSASRLADLIRRTDSGFLTSFYAEDSWRPFARLLVSPGVRLTRYDAAGSSYLDPRVSAEYQVTPDFRVHGGWAIDHQVANRITHEDRAHGDSAFWALSDGSTIPVARARQVAVGARMEMKGILLDLALYHRALDDLTLVAPRLFPGVAPEPGSTILHRGSGTARGAELFFQRVFAWNAIGISYTASRVEHTFPTLEAATFPASHDRPQELKVVDTARIAGRWWISAAWVAGSGQPYTPSLRVEPVWFPTGATVNQVTFGAKNSERLAAYHRLDVSGWREFRLGPVVARLGATLFNVYNRENHLPADLQTAGSALDSNGIRLLGRSVSVFAKIGF